MDRVWKLAPLVTTFVLIAATGAHKATHPHPTAAASSDAAMISAAFTTMLWAVWIVCWLISIVVAAVRKSPALLACIFIGWIGGPISIIIACVIKPRATVHSAAPVPAIPQYQEQLDAINRGELSVVQVDGIMPLHGETFFFSQPARYGQTYKQQITRGSSPALYVPLGHGFRARVGGYSGHSETITNFMWGPYGVVAVSNKRVVFKTNGTADAATAPFEEIVSFEVYPNGLGLQVRGVGTMQFQTNDPLLGALFKKIVEQRSAATSQPEATA